MFAIPLIGQGVAAIGSGIGALAGAGATTAAAGGAAAATGAAGAGAASSTILGLTAGQWALAGTALSAGSTVMGMRSQQQAAKQQAKVHKMNERIAEEQTHARIKRERRRSKRFMAQQRQAFANAGVLETGTPLTVMANTAFESELAAQDTLYAGQTAAAGHRARAGYSQTEASSIGQAMPLAVGSTILSGVNQYAQAKL